MELFISPLIGLALNSFSPFPFFLFFSLFFFLKIRRSLAMRNIFSFFSRLFAFLIDNWKQVSSIELDVRINIQFPGYPLYNCIIHFFLFPPSFSLFLFFVAFNRRRTVDSRLHAFFAKGQKERTRAKFTRGISWRRRILGELFSTLSE